MRRYLFVVGSIVLLVLLIVTATRPVLAQTPSFDPNNFHHPLDIANPYLPMRAGTTLIYEGTKDGQPTRDTFFISNGTKVVDGVTARVVHDTLYVNGVKSEFTDDWFAQDDAGNMWYLGEATTEVGPPVSHEGSWEAGKKGAQPGIVMEAHPNMGDTYQHEYAPGVAQDTATVLSLNQSICVPYGCFRHELETKESSPLEPGVVKHKYYASGIGEIKSIMVQGGSEEQHLVSIQTGQ
jgi:hypothetical protein